MSSNFLKQSVYLTISILITLVVLSFIPETFYEALNLKKIDLLADVRSKEIKKTKKPSIRSNSNYLINCPQNLVCIENINRDSAVKKQLAESVFKLKNKKKIFRIAFFGDSFVEGDMLTGDLRDTLQQVLGGAGIGYMPITSQVAGYRISITHTYSKDWKTYSIIDRPRFNTTFGIGGYTFIPSNGSWVKYSGVGKSRLSKYSRIKILYADASGEQIQINQSKSVLLNKTNNHEVQELVVELAPVSEIKLIFEQLGQLKIYGVSLEDCNDGIILDNFSMRGNSGIDLEAVSSQMYMKVQEFWKYDLVIMQYGLNVANSTYTDYEWYARGMAKVFKHLKKSFDHCPILLVGVSDRGSKSGTMKGIVELLEVQKTFAETYHLLFYNLFEAMGGEGSMVEFVERKWANKDYTHLTFAGGRYMAGQFAKAILFTIQEIKKKQELIP